MTIDDFYNVALQPGSFAKDLKSSSRVKRNSNLLGWWGNRAYKQMVTSLGRDIYIT